MISMMLEASRRVLYLTTFTSGLMPLTAISAESTFGVPIRSVVWMTWRCRLERSTSSSSTMPSVPTPAAARESAVGGPEPAGAEQQHLRVEQLRLALEPDLGDEQVARVALALLAGQRHRDLDVV